MSLVYITVGKIDSDEVLANMEFAGDTWMDALDAAYMWLKTNRIETNYYHVWA